MPKRVSNVISILLHPLLMPTYSVLLLFSVNTYISRTIPIDLQLLVTTLVLINTFILPGIFIIILHRRGFLSSIYLDNQKERTIPFIMAFFFYGFTYYLLKRENLPPTLNALMFGAVISVLISSVFNFFTKISIHMVGITGVFGAFYAISLTFGLDILGILLALVFGIGSVGSARLSLNKHTPIELILGTLIGFVSEFLVVINKWG